MKKFLPALFCLALAPAARAQDLHFSMMGLAPMQQNPALAGTFHGDYRAGGSYRSQWRSVPVPYQTTTFFADGKLLDLGSLVVSGGFKFDSDRAGDAAISWTNATLFGSVARVLSANSAFSVGLGLGGGQRKFDISKLRWGKQYVDGAFASGANTFESFEKTSGMVPETAAGANYHFQKNEGRTRLDLGLGAFHLTRPTVSFKDEKASRLPVRFNAHAGGSVQAGAMRDFLVEANFQKQGPYKEVLASAGLRRWLKPEQAAASFLLGVRLGDAIVPQVRLEWGPWLAAASYDWNFSGLNDATLGKGGPEVAVQWRFVKVPPVKVFKVCPIY